MTASTLYYVNIFTDGDLSFHTELEQVYEELMSPKTRAVYEQTNRHMRDAHGIWHTTVFDCRWGSDSYAEECRAASRADADHEAAVLAGIRSGSGVITGGR